MATHITSGNIFDDLGFKAEVAESLKIRAALMNLIDTEIIAKKLTQVQASKLLEMSQPRLSDLRRGKIQNFTIDALVEILTKLDKEVHIVVDNRMVA